MHILWPTETGHTAPPMTELKPSRCPVCGHVPKRSNESNKLYWAIIHQVADQLKPQGKAYTAEGWHEYLKQRFLGAEDIPLPNGKVVQRARSTSSLDKLEMSAYISQVEAWATEHWVILNEQE